MQYLQITMDGVGPDIYDRFIRPNMDHDYPVDGATSTRPPATTPATQTLQTGADPSYHGVYGAYSRPQPGDEWLPTGLALGADALAIPTWMEALDAAGVPTINAWVPNTWPASAYTYENGSVHLGGSHGGTQGSRLLDTHPEGLAREIGATVGCTMLEPGTGYAVDSVRAFRRSRDQLRRRVRVFKDLVADATPAFDAGWCYLFPTDQWQHWHHPDAQHPLVNTLAAPFTDAMEEVAGHVDDLIDACQPDTVILHGDHGLRPYARKASVNHRLVDTGFLQPGDGADAAMGPGHERCPHGVDVEASQAISRPHKVWVRDPHEVGRVQSRLMEWMDPSYDVPVLEKVVQPDWQGPFAPWGPDLVVYGNKDLPGWDIFYPSLDHDLTYGDSVGAHRETALCTGDFTVDRLEQIPRRALDRFGVDFPVLDDAVVEAVEEADGEARDAVARRLETLGYM